MEKVTCFTCGAFCGFIRDDGTGPHLTRCQSSDRETIKGCTLVEELAVYAPKRGDDEKLLEAK